MGSLMAGWDSHVPHPNAAMYNRNKSLTRGDIEAFWKSKKQTEEEHFKDIHHLSPRTKKTVFEESEETGAEQVIQKHGWWVASKWAFLNESPVIASESNRQRYASQFAAAGSSSTGD